ncbi:MAG: M20/M25/M40 family metallo-hydrolase [Gemmatimonadaceae bacterium]
MRTPLQRYLSFVAALGFASIAGSTFAQGRPVVPGNDARAVRDRVRAYRVAHEGAIVRELAALLAIPNIARDSANIRRNADTLVAMLRGRGVEARTLESPGGAPAVYGELRTPGATRTLVLYAHYDGQPVDTTQWASPPWRPTLRDGPLEEGGRVVEMPAAGSAPGSAFGPEWRLYARSASDDKAPIVAMLAALDALRDARLRPTVNLKFFLEGEEEAGSPHLRDMLTRHAALLAADAWIFCDGPVHQSRKMQVVFGVRGTMDLEITTYGPGRALHSGHYGNWAPNPGALMANLLASLRDDDGRILIPGFYDDVRPLAAAERRALDNVPDSDGELRRSLALGGTEATDARLLERLNLPALNIRGIQMGQVGAQASNTINTRARASIDFRLVPDETPARIRELVEAHVRARGYHIVHDEPNADTLRAHRRVARLDWGDGYPGVRADMELPISRAVVRLLDAAAGTPVIRVPTLGGSLPIYVFQEVLRTPLVIVPIVNHDNNQHAANENLRMQNLWDGIETIAVLVAGLGPAWR